MNTEARSPGHAWFILVAAVFAVSSAGAVFQLMAEVPPLLRASWRLQATSLVLLPMFIIHIRRARLDEALWTRLTDSRTIPILLGSAVCLWIHFGTWVWSLDHTSLTHSLLFVTAHPLVIVVGATLLGHRVARRSIAGAAIGFLGAAVTLVGGSGDGQVTMIGDLAAFVGAVAIVGYLIAGRELREWMPLFLYAFPVTFVASILLLLTSLAFEGTTVLGSTSSTNAFGWATTDWLPLIAYLALVPGMVGHTGINHVLRWLPPLVISVSVLFEPIIGSIIGWLLGTSAAPGLWTWAGGLMLVAGMLLVTLQEGSDRGTPDPDEVVA